MSGVFYLAWRYLVWHRGKTAVLVCAVALVAFLPTALQLLVDRTAEDMTARAAGTPLLLGARGSPVELSLSSLYFSADRPDTLAYAEVGRLQSSGLVAPIPLHVSHRVRDQPIVGTTLDYFDFRGLELDRGRPLVQLGEAVLGAGAARALGVDVGEFIVSSPETLFDLAGVYPLRMPVVGVLAPSGTSDDSAVFVDLKTAWVIDGLGHGHQDLQSAEAAGAVLAADGERIVANASLLQYNEITDGNRASFHFHGDLGSYPLTAILPVPHDSRAATLLQGRYLDVPDVFVIEPREVVDELLGTVFAVQRYVLLALAMVGVATVAVVVLVFVLSLRLRRAEMLTMSRLGGARAVVAALQAAEIVIVLTLALVLATLLNLTVFVWGDELVSWLVLQ